MRKSIKTKYTSYKLLLDPSAHLHSTGWLPRIGSLKCSTLDTKLFSRMKKSDISVSISTPKESWQNTPAFITRRFLHQPRSVRKIAFTIANFPTRCLATRDTFFFSFFCKQGQLVSIFTPSENFPTESRAGTFENRTTTNHLPTEAVPERTFIIMS